MNIPLFAAALCISGSFFESAPGSGRVDMTGYRKPQPGLVAVSEDGSLTATWDGEKGQELHARFSVVDGIPTVRELGVRRKVWRRVVRRWERTSCRSSGVTTGVRRTGHEGSTTSTAGTCSGTPR